MIKQANKREPIRRSVSGLSPLYRRKEAGVNRGYTFEEASKLGDIAVVDVNAFLLSHKITASVKSVEKDELYQGIGTDLIWKYRRDGLAKQLYIEVKGDKWFNTGNIFVEIISNIAKQTPGCFIYTKATYIFYYFPESRELNIIDIRKFHKWWKSNENRFKVAYGKTLVREDSDEFYESEGRLVPKKVLIEEIDMEQYILLPS